MAIHLYADLERDGDHARAVKMLEQALASKDPTIRLYAELDQAMLLLGEGKNAEAHAVALEAVKLMQPATQSAGSLSELVGPELTQAVGWVVTATALASGAADVPLHLDAPKYFESDALPRDWLSLARASDPVRREARLRILTFDLYGMGVAQVLPAGIYVLREVARDGKDPDLWVNGALGPTTPAMWGPTALRARAEAARWRGDSEGEQRWTERATKLEAMFKTPKGAVLARMAGLE